MDWFVYSDTYKILLYPKGDRGMDGLFFRKLDSKVEVHPITSFLIKSMEPITQKDIHIARLYVFQRFWNSRKRIQTCQFVKP